MANKIILTGRRFNRLLVLTEAKKRKGGNVAWLCVCDCGAQLEVNGSKLQSGSTKSCGCMARDRIIVASTIHGMYGTPIHTTWKGMSARCYSINHKKYPRYGGRGIIMCAFLRESPANLLALVGNKPSPKHSIGRIENDLGYFCGSCEECTRLGRTLNVRWETGKQQSRNTSSNRLLTFGGGTKTLAEWAEDSGLKYHTFQARIDRGAADPFAPLKTK